MDPWEASKNPFHIPWVSGLSLHEQPTVRAGIPRETSSSLGQFTHEWTVQCLTEHVWAFTQQNNNNNNNKNTLLTDSKCLQPLKQNSSAAKNTVLEKRLTCSHTSTQTHGQKIPVKVTHRQSCYLLHWTLCTWVSGLSPGCSGGERDLP